MTYEHWGKSRIYKLLTMEERTGGLQATPALGQPRLSWSKESILNLSMENFDLPRLVNALDEAILEDSCQL